MTKFNLRIQQTIKNKLRIVLLTLAVFLSLNFILFTDGNNLNSTNDQNYYYSDTTTNCPCPEFDIQFKICEEIKEIIIKQIDNKEVHYYRTKSKCDSDTSYKIIEELVTDSCHKMANLILKNSRFVIITPFTNIDTLKKQNTKCKYGEVKAEIIKKGKDSSSLEIIEYYLNNVYHRDVVKYYYGKSKLANEVAYYPLVQMFIVLLFVIVIIIALQNNYKSTQNQVWAGLAKETAHQLGTPVSSLEGWVEMLRDIKGNETIVPEMEKDVKRLLLITDRFGKIGSKPNVEQRNLVVQVGEMVEYIKKRASQKVEFKLIYTEEEVLANVSPPLFDWVIENLLKNALDAMEGKGNISVAIFNENTKAIIEVTDTGKGISKANVAKVFKAGFTTKKRGWGLGLTLTKRIVEQYHKGNIFVKHSELGKGTCFRIEINK